MKKFKEIPLINTFLCFCVVMIHLTSDPVENLTFGTFWHTVIYIINRALWFSVPAFLFLSGLKLYNKYGGEKVDLKGFYMGRLKKIVVPYVICVLIYFAYFFSKGWADVKSLPKYILLGTLVAHCYYIVIAVQSYIIFPLLKKGFDRFPRATTVVSLICSVIFAQFWRFEYTGRFLGTYIFYFVSGMFFAKYRLYKKIKKIYPWCVAGYVAAAVIHISLLYRQSAGGFWYRYAELVNIVYVTLSIGVIYGTCLILSQRCKGLCRCAQIINNTSFSIYLYHIMVLSVLKYDILPRFNLTVGDSFVISAVVIYGVIFIYSWLVEYIKRNFKKR
ncbi:MAG: acyltransferase [Oscillospiraceae bacterium]|nr:acyltransferase [Oscillospiraceae bacterium]